MDDKTLIEARPPIPRLTYEHLVQLHACDVKEQFRRAFPDGLLLTPPDLYRAQRLGFPLDWVLEHLPSPLTSEFAAIMQSATNRRATAFRHAENAYMAEYRSVLCDWARDHWDEITHAIQSRPPRTPPEEVLVDAPDPRAVAAIDPSLQSAVADLMTRWRAADVAGPGEAVALLLQEFNPTPRRRLRWFRRTKQEETNGSHQSGTATLPSNLR